MVSSLDALSGGRVVLGDRRGLGGRGERDAGRALRRARGHDRRVPARDAGAVDQPPRRRSPASTRSSAGSCSSPSPCRSRTRRSGSAATAGRRCAAPSSSAPRGIPINRPPAELRAGRAELARLCQARGRAVPPALTLRNDVRVLRPGQSAPASAHGGRVLAGEPAALVDQIGELADCGVEHLVLSSSPPTAASSTSRWRPSPSACGLARLSARRAAPRMAVHRCGRGPDLVLFHGGMGSWRHWIRNVEPLAARFTVHALDHPSYGDSAPVAARDDRPRLPRPRARPARRDASGRRAAAVRRASRSAAPSPPTSPAGSARASPTCASSRPAASRRGASASGPSAATRKPGDDERSSARSAATTCSSTCSAMRPASPRRRVDIQVDGVRRARFDSRKVSGGGTLLGDLAHLTCQIRLLWGERDDSAVPARRPADRRDPRGRRHARPAPDSRGPATGRRTRTPPEVNRLLLEFFSSET